MQKYFNGSIRVSDNSYPGAILDDCIKHMSQELLWFVDGGYMYNNKEFNTIHLFVSKLFHISCNHMLTVGWYLLRFQFEHLYCSWKIMSYEIFTPRMQSATVIIWNKIDFHFLMKDKRDVWTGGCSEWLPVMEPDVAIIAKGNFLYKI